MSPRGLVFQGQWRNDLVSGQEQKSTEEVEAFSLETWKKVKDGQEETMSEKEHLLCMCYYFSWSLASKPYRDLRRTCLFLPSSPPPFRSTSLHPGSSSFVSHGPLHVGQLHCLEVRFKKLVSFSLVCFSHLPLPVCPGDNSTWGYRQKILQR